MKSYISSIVLLNDKEKRIVPLEQGVNIITGDSKTGKSALVEIIDYCLCSSRSTVPKGKITEFTTLFCITLVIQNCCYVVARQSSGLGAKMYLSTEAVDFDPNTLTLSYFDDKALQSPKEVQLEIECALGLSVSNMQTDSMDAKPEKASLRNMVSYLFQHQNLMASKFALFYRFNDFYKRKAVIQQFPIFAGLVEQEYYSKLIRITELKAKLKKLKKNEETNKISSEKIKMALSPLLEDYFALLNLPFDNSMSLPRMIKTANDLPTFDDSPLFNDQGIMNRYHELCRELDDYRQQEHELSVQISDIENANRAGTSFIEVLDELKEKTKISTPEDDASYVCPLCGNSCDDINGTDQDILDSSSWLEDELSITSKYTTDFSEEIRKLSGVKDDVVKNIKLTWGQMKDIERNYINSQDLLTKKEQVEYAKVKVYLYAEMVNTGVFKNVDQDITELQDEILRLESEIDGFDLDTEMKKAQAFISANMNKLALSLDFEDEYKPIDLNFGLTDETFDMYHHQNHREKIFLYEMGSGANWVSCHITLFLSLLRYFCKNPKSPMLSIMFFDQPSQVYFPNPKVKTSSDIIAVQNMYKTIFDEINSIGKDYGVLPQIIIVDHVSGSELVNQDEFLSYIRKDWRDGNHLI